MEKDNIQNLLLKVGRQMVRDYGADALTVRKLSEASGCSVGAIYNQFANMENFVVIINYLTMENLVSRLEKVKITKNPYVDMNNLLTQFVDFVTENKNLWYLLYSFHLKNSKREYSLFYLRKVVRIIDIVNKLVERIVPNMEVPERVLSAEVLWLTVFSVSSLLTNDILDNFSKVDKQNICQILFNTYIAGLTVLEKK